MSPPSTTPALGQPPEPGWTADIDRLAPPREARGWLTELGLLTERVRSRCHGTFVLRIVDERLDLLSPADAAALEVADLSAFVREIELTCDDRPQVFAQTLVPSATLTAQPWLAQLGDTALGPRLASLGGALRDPLEYARLSPGEPLCGRALHDSDPGRVGLWARRARYRLGPHCLVVQEVFLPEVLA
jgi:chorismate--pyruvate lyase